MNKTLLPVLLLSALCLTGCKSVMLSPTSMASANFSYGADLQADKVTKTRESTIVQFTMTRNPGEKYRYRSDSYLLDESGRRYRLHSAEGLDLDTWSEVPEGGKVQFTMTFDPLPKEVKVFDFIEGEAQHPFMLLGIRDKKADLTYPTLQEISSAYPYRAPGDWFCPDGTATVTLRGRIEGYDAQTFGFKQMDCTLGDVFDSKSDVVTFDIAPDGTFERSFKASYPKHYTFSVPRFHKSKVGFKSIPFYARPGETIDVTVRKNEEGRYECYYNNGSSQQVARWLKSSLLLHEIAQPLDKYQGRFADIGPVADQVWNNLMWRVQTVAQRDHFTAQEVHLALADAQVNYAYAVLDNAMMHHHRGIVNTAGRRDGLYYDGVVDSTIYDIEGYKTLHRVNWNNPMLFASPQFRMLENRMEYAELVERHLGDSVQNGINSFGKPYKRSPLGQEMQKYRNRYTQLREMMGTHLDNLMAQICVYNSAISYATLFWSREEDKRNLFLADTTLSVKEREDKAADMVSITTMMPHLLPTFANHYIHDRAEAYMNQVLDKTSLTIPLPDNDDTAYKIFEYCMKYPDKYLFIDFWGMGCGPCRASIEQDMGQRASIASRDDVKVIYIAAEREPGGSQAYRDYVEKWMFDGEEVVCVTDEEFARFQELFQFSGIPHYELITPKCRRVRDDMKIRGFTSFELQFEELKEKLK